MPRERLTQTTEFPSVAIFGKMLLHDASAWTVLHRMLSVQISTASDLAGARSRLVLGCKYYLTTSKPSSWADWW